MNEQNNLDLIEQIAVWKTRGYVIFFSLIGIGFIFYFIYLAKNGSFNFNQINEVMKSKKISSKSADMKKGIYQLKVQLYGTEKLKSEGTAVFKVEENKIIVTILLPNYKEQLKTILSKGTCDAQGEVKYTLADVIEGKSETVLEITIEELKKLAPLAVRIRKSTDSAGKDEFCGDKTESR